MDYSPSAEKIQTFLDRLFGDQCAGRVELAWTDAQDGRLRHARTFDLADLDQLVEEAVTINGTEGQNCYVGAALRQENVAPFGRCSDQDFLAAPAFWADLDDRDAVANAADRYNGTPPNIVIATGRKPHPRVQMWWRLDEPCTVAAALRAQNAALATAFAGDSTVINVGRVMALAGTVKWPIKPGRVVEMVELLNPADAREPAYLPEQIARAFPLATSTAALTNTVADATTTDFGLGVDPAEMLRAVKHGNWHAPMRAFAAHCVSAGYPDWLIIEASRQVLDDPNDPRDVERLIETARRKWRIPNPGDKQPSTGPLNVVGMGAFLALDLPPRETLLAPWLPAQGLVLAYAERGIGKTYFAMNVAHAVATAGAYLGWKAGQRQRRILYLDGEMPAPTMQERGRAIAGFNPPDDLDDWFRLATPDLQPGAMPDLSTAEGQALIEPHLDGVELVVIDNLSTLCRTGIENEAESWLPVQGWLLDLRRRGLSVLLVHHASKSGVQRGTSRREDVLDTVIALRRPKDYDASEGARFEIHFEKARGFTGDDARPIEARLEMDDHGFAAWTVKNLGAALVEKVAELSADGLSLREIGERVGKSKSQVERLLKKAGE